MSIVSPHRHGRDTTAPPSLPVDLDAAEPTDADLAAIEREWPVIEAELEELDAWIQILIAGRHASGLDWRRLRRAQRRLLAAQSQHSPEPAARVEVA